MNPAKSREIVIFSMVATGAIVVIAGAAKGELPKPRQLIALGATYVFLAALADTVPNVAGPAAGLVTITTAIVKGQEAFTAVSGQSELETPFTEGKSILDGIPLIGAAVEAAGNPSPGVSSVPGVGAAVTGQQSPPVPSLQYNVIGRPYGGTHTLGNWQSDRAIDIACPSGTPCLAVQSGTISKVKIVPQSGGRYAGSQVTLDGTDDEFFYTHLSSVSVRAGQSVIAGSVIGASGSANGVDHLHFASRNRDPKEYYK